MIFHRGSNFGMGGRPGTKRRTMARQAGGTTHSTVVEFSGDENEVTQAIRKAEQPTGRTTIFGGSRTGFGMQPGAHGGAHAKLREVAPSESVEEKSATMSITSEQVAVKMTRRTVCDEAKGLSWAARGMFRSGQNGAPVLRGAKKFTK